MPDYTWNPNVTGAIRAALRRVVKEEHIDTWLRTPNRAFGGERPIDLITRGEGDRVLRVANEMEANTTF